MRGATPEEFASAVHAHILKQLKKMGGWSYGVVQTVDGTVPPTLTITLRGSSRNVPGVRYGESYAPIGGDTVCVLIGAQGDLFVIDGAAE